ncbi:MAG: hypothetical protein CBE11_03820 [Rickettsiales bacterium TMED251]|nr:MAG: hypothetical protein CBE11_03820 [Rickettsiales bacterium TMED251]|tara:strand:+ start:19227 stop:19832 length:606 start_codon:yes stop_codon:yes gene_type:complete
MEIKTENVDKKEKKNIILFAAGGHAISVYEILNELNFSVIAYIEKEKKKWLQNISFLSEDRMIEKYNNFQIAIGLGGTYPNQLKDRLKKILAIESTNNKFATLIHPKSIVAKDALIEEGVVIMPGAIIRSKVKIEKYSIINTGSIIEHNALIKKGSHVAPGAVVLGAASCGECSMIGSKSVILQNKVLTDGSFVKAGEVYK